MSYPEPQSGGGSRVWLWLVGGAVVLVLAGCICCGGAAYFGMQIVTEEVAEQLRYHPVVLEQLGEVEEFKVNWAKSINEDDNMDLWVYDVKGTKGSGVITCEHVTNDAGNEEILWATLKLPDGREFDLDLDE
jgi:hypothetical protein